MTAFGTATMRAEAAPGVPEPASILLLASGLVAVVFANRSYLKRSSNA